MSTQEKGTFVPPALDSTPNLPTVPGEGATPQDYLLYCQQMLAHYNGQLERFVAIFEMQPLHVQQFKQIVREINFYSNSSDTWRSIVRVSEGQDGV